jgi:quercetin dioxygenase-like cupin family protein
MLHAALGTTGEGFADTAPFACAYPEASAELRHRLAGHPLFTLAALKALALRLPVSDMLGCRGDVPVNAGAAGAPPTGRSVAETIDTIGRCGSWVVMKRVEQDAAYGALLETLLAEIAPEVRSLTGPMLRREAFVFVSSPGATTPFHFDPEHNILMQLQGTKTVTVLPPGDERIAPGPAHEAYHLDGSYGLEWRDELAPLARSVTMAPGDALYIPVKAPHWVLNGADVSVSLSITWRSGWSLRENDAHGCNRILRRIGFNPRPPRRFPADNRAKALAFQCIRKARHLVGAGA